ncbi:glycosyltransferase family 39 protein [Candidatus Saccharibacteria bacterium]|nr:glycosyltransferase family 39 protein [Candidatus Saccharibacteria bacterium]
MKKVTISRLFLYRHRFIIGYILLAIALLGLIFGMPLISPDGLSETEMESAVTSYNTSIETILDGDVVDLPYHFLQKFSISLFGLSAYSIKLPSIILGAILALLLILLLNRWFKNNVAIIASILTVLSAPFLFIAGSGTPLIMLVFWPTLLLWLGSKIQGKTLPKTIYTIFFGIFVLLSLTTPYICYFVAFVALYALLHPHLRFILKSLPKALIVIALLLAAGVIAGFTFEFLKHPESLKTLAFTDEFSLGHYFANIKDAFLPFLSWNGNIESVFLSPMIGLASLALAFTGLISTAKGFFASRNSIASIFIVFTIALAGLEPPTAVLIIIPFAILTAHGIRYILEKWYGLFPENPYARIFGLIPISIILGTMIVSSLNHYLFGYRYNPVVANEFNEDLALIYEKVPKDTTILVQGGTLSYDFYKILEDKTDYTVTTTVSNIYADAQSQSIATLGKWPTELEYGLSRIITSPKSMNSDRIYLYEGVKKQEN